MLAATCPSKAGRHIINNQISIVPQFSFVNLTAITDLYASCRATYIVHSSQPLVWQPVVLLSECQQQQACVLVLAGLRWRRHLLLQFAIRVNLCLID